eukprot:TRINITY_DN91040_c0_g1_i1.p1 TRINITY_DN91040_c0_g1~~TRINITY_DN91040_c0_g1_i1.p1  ORF type:complete len:337 (-),score=47.07 TRINITY_DN91040_c0_g1_i1:236-1246(-)
MAITNAFACLLPRSTGGRNDPLAARIFIDLLKILGSCAGVFARFLVAPALSLLDGATCRRVQLSSHLDGYVLGAPGCSKDRVILYFHGGAHVLFSAWTHRELLGRISAQTGATIVAVNYRLAPEQPFPAGLEDAMMSWRWVQQQYPAASIAVAGDSAGGNLAFSLITRLSQLRESQPIACVGLSPWLLLDPEHAAAKQQEIFGAMPPSSDCTAALQGNCGELEVLPEWRTWKYLVDVCGRLYAQGQPLADPLISPALAGEEIVQSFPPTLIHVDEQEPLVVDAMVMAARCKEAGVTTELKLYSNTTHVFQANHWCYPRESQDSLHRIRDFLAKQWS